MRPEDIKVERRFLLFQLDYGLQVLQEFCLYNPFTNQRDASNTPKSIKIGDPMEYEDTESNLYWRNITDPNYRANYEVAIKDFRQNLFDLINSPDASRRISLRSSGGLPFRDISPFVKKISGYTANLNGFENSLTMTLARDPKTTSPLLGPESSPGFDQSVSNIADYLDLKENDVIMVRVSRDGGKSFELEYLGFVTPIRDASSYGAVDDVVVGVSGISKGFHTTSIIKQGAINQDQFVANVEVNSPTTPSQFANHYENKNTGQIFSSILSDLLGLRKTKPSDGLAIEQVTGYILDDGLFTGSNAAGFQNNILLLLTLYLMQNLAQDVAVLQTPLFSGPSSSAATKPTGAIPAILDTPVRAYLQHGEHLTYNRMIADGFSNFFAQLATGAEVFGDVRGTTFYELFESRNGTIICRPPRYNKLELNPSDIEFVGIRDVKTIETIFERVEVRSPDNSSAFTSYRFRRDSDFYVKKEDQADKIDVVKNDLELDTHVDVQFSLPSVGVIEYPAGGYTDPNLLIKYGLRSKGPLNNPNALNPNLAKIYATIALGMNNAETRQASASLWDTRPYRFGKLYYFESENIVAYAIASTISEGYSSVNTNNLETVMVRRVIEKPIKELLKAGNENALLNFALCYLQDFKPDPKKTSPKTGTRIRATLIQNARAILEAMLGDDTNATVLVYRYIPSILDMIYSVEDDPGLSTKDDVNKQTKEAANIDRQRLKNGLKEAKFDPDTRRFYSTNVTKVGVATLDEVSKAMEARRPDLTHSAHVFPLVGAYQYGNQLPTDIRRSVNGNYVPVTAISTPFFTDQISKDPASFLFSQLLLNRMADVDLDMKYKLFGGSRVFNELGFPQVYGVVNGAYRLFGSMDSPDTFYSTQSATALASFNASLFASPNALLFSSSGFSNNFLSVPALPNGVLNMPTGHFVASAPMRFYTFSGGRVRITGTGPTYVITALSPDGFVEQDTALTTARASLESPQGVGVQMDFGESANTPTSTATTEITVNAPNGLYFISPFTDLSLERMMEWGLNPDVAGFRTESQVKAVRVESSKNLLSARDLHREGQGLDISPDALVRSSGSDLRMVSGAYESRLRFYLARSGFFGPPNSESLTFIPKAVTLEWKYLDGSPGTSVSPAYYAHLGVTDVEVKNELASIADWKIGVLRGF